MDPMPWNSSLIVPRKLRDMLRPTLIATAQSFHCKVVEDYCKLCMRCQCLNCSSRAHGGSLGAQDSCQLPNHFIAHEPVSNSPRWHAVGIPTRTWHNSEFQVLAHVQIVFHLADVAAVEDASEQTDAGFVWRQLDRGCRYDVTGMCLEFVRT
jgi:hypothetical protein